MEGLGVNPAFWKDKRVFLTGHTGFKGSWLTLWLQSLGAHVTGFSLEPPTTPNLFTEARLAQGMESVLGDIRDLRALQASLQAAHPEIVIHMAAQPLVRPSYEDPVATYSTNVMGTVHLLEAVRQTSGVKAVVIVTTDKCYENREWVWGYRENEPMGGFDPYSNSKGCAELVSAAYRNSFFNPDAYNRHGVAVATARAGNVIGGGDWARDRLIPDMVQAFEQGKPVQIRNPQAVRPWQHVLEPLRGYMTLAERLVEQGPAFAEAWNFGPMPHDEQTVGWIVQNLAQLWGDGANWAVDQGPHPHEANHLRLDISKAQSQLGWTPALGLQQALEKVVRWYKDRAGGRDVRELTLGQIQTYQNSLPPIY